MVFFLVLVTVLAISPSPSIYQSILPLKMLSAAVTVTVLLSVLCFTKCYITSTIGTAGRGPSNICKARF